MAWPSSSSPGTRLSGAIVLFCMLKLGNCLKDMQLNVPEAVAVGDTVTLSCQYDLETDVLYLMRWTLDSVEFYRYVPKEEPAARSFNDVSGVIVDMRKSNSHNVTIRGVTRNHTGLYQCEVSADAPLFHTLHKSAQMQVAVMPQMEPTMNVYGVATGEDNKRHINYGDHLKASCIAGPSSPTVNFTWRVNDVVFPSTTDGNRERSPVPGPNWESKEAWSELVFTVDNALFTRLAVASSNSLYSVQSGGGGGVGGLLGSSGFHRYNNNNYNTLKVRCETNIFSLYRGRAEVDLEILEDHWPLNGLGSSSFGAKVSPTTDLRGSNNPDNSALTGSSLAWGRNCLKHWLIRMVLLLGVLVFCS